MSKQTRPSYSPEFKLETAQWVIDQGYSIIEAHQRMNVSRSAMEKWVRQLKNERKGIANNSSPVTPEQIKIKELEKKIKRIELEKEILKKATALLVSDSLNGLS